MMIETQVHQMDPIMNLIMNPKSLLGNLRVINLLMMNLKTKNVF